MIEKDVIRSENGKTNIRINNTVKLKCGFVGKIKEIDVNDIYFYNTDYSCTDFDVDKILICEYCEEEKTILTANIGIHKDWEVIHDNFDIKIMREKYLTIGNTEDMNCLEHVNKVEINFCPICRWKVR